MDNRYAISNYPDAAAVTKQLDELIKLPIYTISPEALKRYEEDYFDKKCAKSKEMIEEAKTVIPGGVQHNLAFNHPFPLVFTKAEARISMMSTATNTMTFCRLAALRCSDLTQRLCAIRSLNCSTPAALPPACSTNLNTSLPKRYAIACPMLKCSACSTPVPRPAWLRCVSRALPRRIKTSSRWAAPITAGAISSLRHPCSRLQVHTSARRSALHL